MNTTEARRRAEQLFTRKSDDMTGTDYEARSREVQQKIEYLRQLRLAAQARRRPGVRKRPNGGQRRRHF